MTPSLLACAVLVGGGLFWAAWSLVDARMGPVSSGSGLLGRIEHYSPAHGLPGSPGQGFALRNLAGSLRRALFARARPIQPGAGRRERDQLNDKLQKAGIPLRPAEWRAAWVCAALAAGLGVGLRVQVVVGLAVGLAVGLLGGRLLVGYRLRRRTRQFESQLGDVILMLASAVRGGYAFPQALMTVSATAPAPIGPELGRASREIQLGLPVDEALRRLVARNPSEDLDLMITAVQIHRIIGGNLTEILESIAATIRDRVRIKGDIRTLTAQARASGWIVSLLPIALAGLLALIAPDYFTPMLTQPAGWFLLGSGGLSMLCGIAIIRRIVAISV